MKVLRNFWGIALLLVVWQIWVMNAHYNSIVVVSPIAVVEDIVAFPMLYLGPLLWTFSFAICGLALGMLSGVLLAGLGWRYPRFSGLSLPLILLLTATPVVCLIPLLTRIFGYERKTELICVAVMTLFPSFVYTTSGLRNLPHRSAELFSVLHASRGRHFVLLALPSAMPNVAIALRVGASSSILVTVVAEYLMQTGGLGGLFAVTMQAFNLRRALGASVVCVVLAGLFYEISFVIEQKILTRFR